MLAVPRYSQLTYQSIILYTLLGRGATKSPVSVLPLCLKPTLALCLAYCTVLLCVAIAACALFEGVRPLILNEHAPSSRNLIMGE